MELPWVLRPSFVGRQLPSSTLLRGSQGVKLPHTKAHSRARLQIRAPCVSGVVVGGEWSLASERLDIGSLGKGKIHVRFRPPALKLLVANLPSARAVITNKLRGKHSTNTPEREL